MINWLIFDPPIDKAAARGVHLPLWLVDAKGPVPPVAFVGVHTIVAVVYIYIYVEI